MVDEVITEQAQTNEEYNTEIDQVIKTVNTAHTFEEKRARLNSAKANLKKRFFGIDAIIDTVIDKLTSWYLFPEVTTRPIIINLWGMTGVGKTDLIRHIVKELGFTDKFMEIQMCNKGSATSWEKSIQQKLNNSDLEPEQPGIVLLDEFQRFRTVDEDGREIHDYNFQDVWMLLSDGKFGMSASFKEELLDMLYDILYKEDRQKHAPDDEDEDDLDAILNEDETAPSKKAKAKNKNDGKRRFNMMYYRAKSLKNSLQTDAEVTDIMTWDEDKLRTEIMKVLTDPTAFSETDYSQLLIFVSGNIDEAFREALSVSDADQDVDDIHQGTQTVNMVTIKDALNERFKPEQISRLGNVHVIYPSLSREAFELIIRDKLNTYQNMIKERFDKTVTFDESIEKFIFQNGVFPVQGVRPVFSTIDDMFNIVFPPLMIHAMEHELGDFDVTYKDEQAIGQFVGTDTSIELELKGALDEIRKDRLGNRDKITLTAVHEAGHALTFIKLFDLAPHVVTLDLTSNDTGGTTYLPVVNPTKTTYMDRLCTGWGGRVAEELIFGEEHSAAGASSDIATMTKMASAYIRQHGWDSTKSAIVPINANGSSDYNTNFDDTNDRVEYLMSEQYERCKEQLKDDLPLLMAIADVLTENLRITGLQLQEICKEYNISCKATAMRPTVNPPYEALYAEAKQKALENKKGEV